MNIDGQHSKNIFLGTNFWEYSLYGDTDVFIETVTPTSFLSDDSDELTLWAKVNDKSYVQNIWIRLSYPEDSIQAETDTRVTPPMQGTFNPIMDRYEWIFDNLSSAGIYHALYFVLDKKTLEILSPKETVIYKNYSGNSAPEPITLLYPQNNSLNMPVELHGERYLMFDWTKSSDHDNHQITYTVEFMEKSSDVFNVLAFENLTNSYLLTSLSDGFAISHNYLWSVQAIDEYGARYTTTENTFRVMSPNDTMKTFQGCVHRCQSDDIITQASVFSNSIHIVNTDNGCYMGLAEYGSYPVLLSLSPYLNNQDDIIDISNGADRIEFCPSICDIDLNGILTIADAILIMQHLVSIEVPNTIYFSLSISENNRLSLSDIIYILKHISSN